VAPKAKKVRVVFSVTNCVCHDQRVMKMTGLVKDLSCDITIVGRRRGNCCSAHAIPFKTIRFNMIFKKGVLFYSFFNIRLFIFLLFRKADLLVSNDLDTLLPNFLVARLKNIPLVYDSHEYFTGVPEIQDRPFVKWVWKSIEKLIFPKLRNVITVSDSIADKYWLEYRVRPLTVRNCAENTEHIVAYTRQDLGLNPDHLLLILQGTGINVDRGGTELLDALRDLQNVSLLIVGSGDQYAYLMEKSIPLGLESRVRFVPEVDWELLIRYTKCADAGVSLDKNTNLNYQFSLPNKLFDYISAGIAVIATDLPEISKIIKEFDCGILIADNSPGEISKAISILLNDNNLLRILKNNSSLACSSLNWEQESRKIKELYRSIIRDL
jgi:glycosyltransferase involved in cell wall biosynthesis